MEKYIKISLIELVINKFIKLLDKVFAMKCANLIKLNKQI